MGQSLDYVLSEEDKNLIVKYYKYGELYPNSKYIRRTVIEARLSHFISALDDGKFHYLCVDLYRAFDNQLIEAEASLNVLVLWDFVRSWNQKSFQEYKALTRREAMKQLLELKKLRLSAKKTNKRKPIKTGHFDTYILGA